MEAKTTTVEWTEEALDMDALNATQQEASGIIAAAKAEAKIQAEAILAEARLQAEEIFKDLEKQKTHLEAEARNIAKLKEESRQQAYAEGLGEAEMLRDEFLTILASFQTAKEKLLKEAEEEIGSIAMLVAEKLLASEIKKDKTSKGLLTKQIRAAIAKVVKGSGLVKVKIATADMPAAKALKKALEASLDEGISLYFEADETVEPASCIIETKGGRFDARFKTQLKVIRFALEKHLAKPLLDLDERYPETEEMISPTTLKEPSKQDLEALMQDLESGQFFADDEELKAKMDEDFEDDDLLEEDDEEEDEIPDEDLDDYGAVDEDLLLEEEEVDDDALFAEDEDEPEDERFPEY